MRRRLLAALLVLGLVSVVLVSLNVSAKRGAKPPSRPSVSFSTSTPTDVGVEGSRSEHFKIVEDSLEGIAGGAGSAGAPSDDTLQVSEDVKIKTNAAVTRVKDGDTFVVKLDGESEEFTVRLLGVNTPETVDPRKPVECFGKEASQFTKLKLADQRVRLDADPQADERDKYGRLLRNATLADGTDFNASLVKEGYAYAYLSFPLTPARKVELKRLETEARTAKRGLWADGACAK